ncbi:hypothetical protein HMPREF9564_00339 [Cutibacterium acnes HL053PA1]|nr:hypothetical protein HMPREF9574_02398 [Cutibacterium acnes HL074PA1]EFS49387.1 hypothetical protein HMPREF9585_00438 [Cutibacterium acnes HL083PA1]EFS70655.1 hypothetical protein HMPREF9617_02362 [Cutibacterium acnes HL056PA1]EFT19472.1 hypothetical protein HMPREF9564_00339 [Cutibacterium acnes HL053PA1]EFT29324.1 hypothetical protein HMPREF9594_00591 [Cutibacterium acnes HL005PA1]EGE93193.1 hypothetical protein HMPREF9571_01104 [Cutibacterium acnes HL043PA2]EGF73246.1 response regulator [
MIQDSPVEQPYSHEVLRSSSLKADGWPSGTTRKAGAISNSDVP